MTQYKTEYPFHVAFPPQRMDDVLAEWLAKQGVRQCHIAETEKYAHVTFFFNGGVEKQFTDEVRDMIASPRVATYDLDPPMSAMQVAGKMAERLAEDRYPFVMNNFAPPVLFPPLRCIALAEERRCRTWWATRACSRRR